MGRWSGAVGRWSVAALATTVAAGALGGCTSRGHPSAASTESAPTQLQQAAAGLDGANTFRLTVDTLIPKTAAAPRTADPPAGPSAPPATESVKMSGVWDVATGLARMDGTVDSVRTTILSASGVEYVSLTPDVAGRSGKKWLKADNSDATFGDFSNPRIVSQLLRAYHEVRVVAPGHLTGTIETSEADRTIADPNLIASFSGLPGTLGFDLWTDTSGNPTRVSFSLRGAGAVTTGTASLDAFGTAAPQVAVPTIADVVQAPAQ
jgi:hypothetical protein